MTTLLTIMHISDLHVGDVENGSASLDAHAAQWWRTRRWFDGFLGHSHDALAAIQRRHRTIRKREGTYPLLVTTGDLSACGDPVQLDAASAYLTSALPVATLGHVGLGVRDAMDRTIPGNHDHWPGHNGIVGEPAGRGPLFSPDPRDVSIPLQVSGHTVRLRIVGINSDADVWPWGPTRLFARGRCESQLAAAAVRFGDPDAAEIRVLLLHHTALERGFVTGLARGTRRRLEQLVADHDVAAVLCGHVHEPRCDTTSPAHRTGSARQCLHACAGTSSQLDEPPPAWGLDDSDLARFRTNSLFVHRLVRTRRGVAWETTLETRAMGTRLFAPAGEPVARFDVWPR